MSKIKLLILFVLSVGLVAGALEVDITTDKPSYKIGEDITLTVTAEGDTEFFDMNLYIKTDSQNIDFTNGKTSSVTNPLYSSLKKNEESGVHLKNGIISGWWLRGTSNDLLKASPKKTIAQFTGKVVGTLASKTTINFDVENTLVKSKFVSYDADYEDVDIKYTTSPATITIEPTTPTGQCTDADGKIYKAGGTPAESCFSANYKPKFCDASGKAVDKCTVCGGCQDTICNKATDACDICTTDTQCATEHPTLPFCSNGQCVKEKPGYCDEKNSRDVCLVGSATPVCDLTKNICVECNENSQCPDNKECTNNKCELKSCTQDSDCPQAWPYCVNKVCQVSPAPQCTTAADCPKYNTCTANKCVFNAKNVLLTVDADKINKDTSIITAHADVGPFTVYTTLKDKSGTILTFGWEEVSGLTKGSTYETTTDYAFPAKVDKRTIVIYNPKTKKIFLDQQYVK